MYFQAPLAYLTAKTYGLEEEAIAIFEVANTGIPSPPPVRPHAELLKPPAPILRHFDINWPQLTITRSFFEGGLFSSDTAISAPIPLLAGNDFGGGDGAAGEGEGVGGGDWGDEDDLDIDEFGGIGSKKLPTSNSITSKAAATAPVDGEGWGDDDDLDILDDGEFEDANAVAGLAGPGVTSVHFVAPMPGESVTEVWVRHSQLAADHVAAGSFETAMQVSRISLFIVFLYIYPPFLLDVGSARFVDAWFFFFAVVESSSWRCEFRATQATLYGDVSSSQDVLVVQLIFTSHVCCDEKVK